LLAYAGAEDQMRWLLVIVLLGCPLLSGCDKETPKAAAKADGDAADLPAAASPVDGAASASPTGG